MDFGIAGRSEESNKHFSVKRVLFGNDEREKLIRLGYIVGAGLAVSGRISGAEWIVLTLPAADFLSGNFGSASERFAGYTAYGAGIASAYVDKICLAAAGLIERM